MTLKELIESDPRGFLGEAHFAKYDSDMTILTKIIDSLSRLTIQVHPDREFAKKVFASDYGKTEAWYILGGRKADGENPYVLLGFKPGITREKWKRLFDSQDIEGMLESLHKIYVKPGEVYYIDGGLPHAIGPGCFLVEIQEPTDYTIRVERKTPEGREISAQLCHQGAGFDKIFDCFHYEGYSIDETLKKYRLAPKNPIQGEGYAESILIGEECTKLFGMRRIKIDSSYISSCERTFSIVIVISGKGNVGYDNDSFDIKQGDSLFIPASAGEIKWKADIDTGLELVRCFPPE